MGGKKQGGGRTQAHRRLDELVVAHTHTHIYIYYYIISILLYILLFISLAHRRLDELVVTKDANAADGYRARLPHDE